MSYLVSHLVNVLNSIALYDSGEIRIPYSNIALNIVKSGNIVRIYFTYSNQELDETPSIVLRDIDVDISLINRKSAIYISSLSNRVRITIYNISLVKWRKGQSILCVEVG